MLLVSHSGRVKVRYLYEMQCTPRWAFAYKNGLISIFSLRQKLLAHQLADNQNANYRKHPNIIDLKYLESLRQTGFWFDGTRHVVRTDNKVVNDIAPLFVLEHKDRYKEYLVHPDNLMHTKFKQPATYYGDYGGNITKDNKNITIAVTLRGRTGNVLFGIGSAMAIAAHYNLNLCVNQGPNSIGSQKTLQRLTIKSS